MYIYDTLYYYTLFILENCYKRSTCIYTMMYAYRVNNLSDYTHCHMHSARDEFIWGGGLWLGAVVQIVNFFRGGPNLKCIFFSIKCFYYTHIFEVASRSFFGGRLIPSKPPTYLRH